MQFSIELRHRHRVIALEFSNQYTKENKADKARQEDKTKFPSSEWMRKRSISRQLLKIIFVILSHKQNFDETWNLRLLIKIFCISQPWVGFTNATETPRRFMTSAMLWIYVIDWLLRDVIDTEKKEKKRCREENDSQRLQLSFLTQAHELAKNSASINGWGGMPKKIKARRMWNVSRRAPN